MSERMIDGRPALPAPEERPALPPPEDHERDPADDARPWYRRPRWIAIAAAVLLLLLVAYCTSGSGGSEAEKGGGQPPSTVTVARAQQVEWGEELRAVGTAVAVQGVDVTTELGGIVTAIRFRNGERAQRGETLVLLDTTTERAQMAAQIAQREQARLAYLRALRLIERGAISQAEVEEARATWQNLVALVRQTATEIEKKRIEAPFSGDLGIRLVSLGQYIAPGTALVSLQQIAPIYVNFELPETAIARVRAGQQVSLTVDAFGGRAFSGRINAINPQVSAQSRNFTAQAIVDNRDRALRPGMFADVTVRLPGTRRVTAVPQSAVTANAYGSAVYLVAERDPRQEQAERERAERAEAEKGGFLSRLFGGGSGDSSGEQPGAEGEGDPAQSNLVARTAFVETGERRGLLIEIRRGLRPGQPVVTAGQLKLQNNAPVTISRPATQGAPERPTRP